MAAGVVTLALVVVTAGVVTLALVVVAVVAVPAVVADVVAVALSSTVEALDLLAAVEILVLFVAPSPQQFEIASLLPPPSPDSGQD